MTPDYLILKSYLAKTDKVGPVEVRGKLAPMLRGALELLLAGYDYENNPKTGPAVCARILAGMIAVLEPEPKEVDVIRTMRRLSPKRQEQAARLMGLLANGDKRAQQLMAQAHRGKISSEDIVGLLNQTQHQVSWTPKRFNSDPA